MNDKGGIGMIAATEPDKADAVAAVLAREGETVTGLGAVVAPAQGTSRVIDQGRLDPDRS